MVINKLDDILTLDQQIAQKAGYGKEEIKVRRESLRKTGNFESLDKDHRPSVIPEFIEETDLADNQEQVNIPPAPGNPDPLHRETAAAASSPPPPPAPPGDLVHCCTSSLS